MIRAVFGGSFDPVHRGHRALVEAVLERDLADVVHVVPAWRSPHKTGTAASAAHRLEMVRLAFAGRAGVRVEDLEIVAGRPVFTVDTLRTLQRRHREDSLRLVLGADQLRAFGRWREPGAILELAELLLFARRSIPLAELCSAAAIPPDRCRCIEEFDEPVSASRIRATLAEGGSVEQWLDAPVAEYIRRHELYRA